MASNRWTRGGRSLGAVLRASITVAAGVVLSVLSTSRAGAQPIVVFGDSLSDTGNIFAFSQSPAAGALGFTPRPTSPWYEPGQFTNGASGRAGLAPTQFTQGAWVNVLADRLGRARPVAAGLAADVAPVGSNYAWGGAQAAEPSLLPAAEIQVGLYLNGPVARVPGAVHTFWFGGNDLINAAGAPGATPASVASAGAAAMSALRSTIGQLAGALGPALPVGGVVNVLWANLPSLDRTPAGAALSPALRQALAQASAEFAAQQQVAAAQLRAQHANLNLVTLDVHGLFNEVLGAPGAYGLIDVQTPVLSAPDFTLPGPFVPTLNVGPGANADQYAFWDRLHPTARMHALIGERAALLIPAPGAAGLLVLSGLLVNGRRRAA
jgi:outer membrane lipase/esterase